MTNDCGSEVSKRLILCRNDEFMGLKKSSPCVEVTDARYKRSLKFKKMTGDLLKNPRVKALLH